MKAHRHPRRLHRHSPKILAPLLVACDVARADEWVSVTKATDEGEPINVFVKTPMIRINGDIRDAATKREYPFQKLADGQSNRFKAPGGP